MNKTGRQTRDLELDALRKNRDECANVFKIDRDHELSGPHPDCGCPSCNLHHKYAGELDVLRQENEGLQVILNQVADEKNWFDDCGEWEWLLDRPDGSDEFGGAGEFVRRELTTLRERIREFTEEK
jgi:hypothetical protein